MWVSSGRWGHAPVSKSSGFAQIPEKGGQKDSVLSSAGSGPDLNVGQLHHGNYLDVNSTNWGLFVSAKESVCHSEQCHGANELTHIWRNEPGIDPHTAGWL